MKTAAGLPPKACAVKASTKKTLIIEPSSFLAGESAFAGAEIRSIVYTRRQTSLTKPEWSRRSVSLLLTGFGPESPRQPGADLAHMPDVARPDNGHRRVAPGTIARPAPCVASPGRWPARHARRRSEPARNLDQILADPGGSLSSLHVFPGVRRNTGRHYLARASGARRTTAAGPAVGDARRSRSQVGLLGHLPRAPRSMNRSPTPAGLAVVHLSARVRPSGASGA